MPLAEDDYLARQSSQTPTLVPKFRASFWPVLAAHVLKDGVVPRKGRTETKVDVTIRESESGVVSKEDDPCGQPLERC